MSENYSRKAVHDAEGDALDRLPATSPPTGAATPHPLTDGALAGSTRDRREADRRMSCADMRDEIVRIERRQAERRGIAAEQARLIEHRLPEAIKSLRSR